MERPRATAPILVISSQGFDSTSLVVARVCRLKTQQEGRRSTAHAMVALYASHSFTVTRVRPNLFADGGVILAESSARARIQMIHRLSLAPKTVNLCEAEAVPMAESSNVVLPLQLLAAQLSYDDAALKRHVTNITRRAEAEPKQGQLLRSLRFSPSASARRHHHRGQVGRLESLQEDDD